MICKKCHRENIEGSNFCKHCGAPIGVAQKENIKKNDGPQESNSKTNDEIDYQQIAAVTFFIILVVVLIIVGINNPGSPLPTTIPITPTTYQSNIQNQNAITSDSDTSTTSGTTVSNTEMCQKHAQEAADEYGSTNSLYYSVDSYHYSSNDNVCYFELHYQMNFNIQGNEYTAQYYNLDAESLSEMKSFPNIGLSTQEASCSVPETAPVGASTDCTYEGLIFSINNNYTAISNKYGVSNAVPMSYSDYEALVQKRMSN